MAIVEATDSQLTDETQEYLRTLVPLHTLPDAAFQDLLGDIQFQTLAKGEMLFRQGDTDHVSFYLLEGTVALLTGDRVSDKVALQSSNARFPIAHTLPRKVTARAASVARVARIDSRRISDLLARSHTSDYEVSDLDEADSGDWMSMLLRSRVMQLVPASNIQRVMMSVEQVAVSDQQALIRQGDPGDYYYMLIKGHALVTRDNNDGEPPAELAKLGPGDGFGEEALLSDSPRNSSITMLSDGEVLRLSKEDFVSLIHTPLSRSLNFEQAKQKVEEGAVWLDLRSTDQYEKQHLPGSLNLPIESLRYQAGSLASDRHYVLYSNSGGRSVAAAFLLTERGFEVSVLAGGLNAVEEDIGEVEAPPPEVQDSGDLQRRMQEAEQRARELEARLQQAEAGVHDIEALKQRHLHVAKDAVERAKRKVIESERERLQALEARKKAYSQMEALTGDLEAAENERTRLADRMREIEGLDAELQDRLEKAERERIAEHDRAESATQSLEELSQRMAETLEQRDAEREEHQRINGELKEELTALMLELEQTRMEMDELREQSVEPAVKDESSEALLAAEMERDELRAEFGDAKVQLAARQAEVDELRSVISTYVDQVRDAQSQESEQIAALKQELQMVREQAEKDVVMLREQLAQH